MKSLLTELGTLSLVEEINNIKTQIKNKPTSADLRAHLFQLLCLQGHWDVAAKQLQPWAALTPIAQPTTALLAQILEGETERQNVISGKSLPAFITENNDWIGHLLKALQYDVLQEHDKADAERNTAYELATISPGELTIKPKEGDEVTHSFEWIADSDNRFGPICELIYNGHYYWLPFNEIREIRFQQPSSVTDLIWRHVSITLKDGRQQVCQLPARYPLPADQELSNELLLARRTEWQPLNSDDYYLGLGQRMLIIDEMEFPILDLTSIIFK